MKDGVRELARQFKAFLQTREEDELTPLSFPQGGAEQTVPAATQTPENTPQDHLTIEFARAAHKETEKQSVGQHPEMHTPEYQAAAAQNTAPVLSAANAENAAEDLFGQPGPVSAAVRAEAAQQPQNAPVQEAPVTPQEKQAALDKIAEEINACKKAFGQKTTLGARRTQIADAPVVVEVPIEAMVEKEPITVVLSEQGWIKALKGQVDPADVKFKEGDKLRLSLNTYTTDHIMFFATNGRFYTLLGDKVPGGRGFGEPVRLSIDLPEDADIVTMFIWKPDVKLLVATSKGKGFIVNSSDIVASTRAGKIILNVADGDKAVLCVRADGDHVAVIGNNRKMLVFKADEIPSMARGSGVILQKYAGGKLSDVKFFNLTEGLSFPSGNGIRVERDLTPWLGKRAGVGKIPPVGFPRSNKF